MNRSVEGPPERFARVRMGPGGEFDLIRSILGEEGDPSPGIRVGPGDDALVLDDGTVVSTDLSIEGVHFVREWLSEAEIGYRASAAALSDLAAMAAEPLGALVSLALPRDGADETVPDLARGVHEALAAAGGTLLGGDLSASPGPLVLDVVVLGRAGRPVLRGGARPGDELWVTGHLGGSAAAVAAWREGREPEPGLRRTFARPRPRIREALWLAREGGIRALIDLSDGLAGDAAHLAAAGDVRIVLEGERIPLHPALAAGTEAARTQALDRALSGGEDFELLMAVEPGVLGSLIEEFTVRFGAALTRIGRVEAGEGVHLLQRDEPEPRALRRGGFSHFGRSPSPPKDEDGP